MEVEIDVAVNVVGTLASRHGGAALVSGSHIDTVEDGGRFDGVVDYFTRTAGNLHT